MCVIRFWNKKRRVEKMGACFGGLLLSSAVFVAGTSGTASAAPVPLRGVIEGFYGTPWQEAQRLDILDFCRAHQLNAYILSLRTEG